jgi:type 1 glutamine amidotransferase
VASGDSAFRHGKLDIDFSGAKQPITRGFTKLRRVDESHWNLVGDPASVDALGKGLEDGRVRPVFWIRQAGTGRVFLSIPGHYSWTFDDALFGLLILRGIPWCANELVDHFNELASVGASIGE